MPKSEQDKERERIRDEAYTFFYDMNPELLSLELEIDIPEKGVLWPGIKRQEKS